jgi:hypothetical protein
MKLLADRGAAQGIDHGHRVIANDEARIRHIAAIFRRLHLVATLMHEDTRRDFRDLETFTGMTGKHAQQGRRRERNRAMQEGLA